MAGTDDSVGFESQIKPLFRESDRRAMEMHFDLWSYDDVSANADPILERLRDGSMPCDGPWPAKAASPCTEHGLTAERRCLGFACWERGSVKAKAQTVRRLPCRNAYVTP